VSTAHTFEVAAEERDLRLDRWFRRHFPALAHGHLQKLLRTGQVRLDGKRVRADARLAAGQKIRVPPFGEPSPRGTPPRETPSEKAAREEAEAELRGRIIYQDDRLIAINKPAGLAVQGGTKVVRHVDALLDGLRMGAPERPRLVHRLDRDTSGVLLLARDPATAARLTSDFRRKAVRKIYWALVKGVPKIEQGRIDAPLAKKPSEQGERVAEDIETGKRAVTYYRVVERAGRRVAWLALLPVTGRTHQLRVHCVLMGTPIVGDVKYGGREALLEGFARQPHLHAREVVLNHPAGRELSIVAPLPPHMAAAWNFLGFEPSYRDDPFRELSS
jgi:23S rRNA pseudouridine955/2504/2580 synthase